MPQCHMRLLCCSHAKHHPKLNRPPLRPSFVPQQYAPSSSVTPVETLDLSIAQGPSSGPRAPKSHPSFGYVDRRSHHAFAARPMPMHNSIRPLVWPTYHTATRPPYLTLTRPSTPSAYHEGLAPNAWNDRFGEQPIPLTNPPLPPVGPACGRWYGLGKFKRPKVGNHSS